MAHSMIFRSRWLQATAVLVAGSLLGCGQQAPPVAAPQPSAAAMTLEQLVQEYAKIERRSDDDDAPSQRDVSAQAFHQKIEARRQLLRKVQQVGAQGLSREEDIDRRLMIGLLESTIHTSEARRIWENDAALYVPAVDIGKLLEPTAPGTPAERAAELSRLLGEVPTRLEEGRKNLRQPPRDFTESAIFKSEGTLKLLGSNAAAFAAQVGGEAGERLTAASKTAQTALADYLKFLRQDLLPRSTGTWVLGKENYDYVLQHRWMMQADADDILARGRRAFEATEA